MDKEVVWAPDETVTAEKLLLHFWWWRKSGRGLQTLHGDLSIFLTVWQHRAGWKVCSEVYRQAMAKLDWDTSLGGMQPRSHTPLPPKKKGLYVYE